MEIGNRLQIARKALGYTLERVAAETGMSQSSLSDFENGKREPRFSQLSKLAALYRRTIEFFLSDKPFLQTVLLWRDGPATNEQRKEAEAHFCQLCEQYHRLEILLGEKKVDSLPTCEWPSDSFGFAEANTLAEKFQREHLLGDVPSASLKQMLEERLYVKVFHLEFAGSAISTRSAEFGPAILLNSTSKLWRRNYDLAHELFHLLTWSAFRSQDSENQEPGDREEKLANAFASRLLLPTDAVKNRIERVADRDGHVTLESLDEVAREFGVSLEALLWRLLYLYRMPVEKVQEYIERAKVLRLVRPSRSSDDPDVLPERYCSLAIRALNEGKLSLIQFAKYMGLGYKKAQEYLVDEGDLTDEEVSIPVA